MSANEPNGVLTLVRFTDSDVRFRTGNTSKRRLGPLYAGGGMAGERKAEIVVYLALTSYGEQILDSLERALPKNVERQPRPRINRGERGYVSLDPFRLPPEELPATLDRQLADINPEWRLHVLRYT
jgi:hypothetical protein